MVVLIHVVHWTRRAIDHLHSPHRPPTKALSISLELLLCEMSSRNGNRSTALRRLMTEYKQLTANGVYALVPWRLSISMQGGGSHHAQFTNRITWWHVHCRWAPQIVTAVVVREKLTTLRWFYVPAVRSKRSNIRGRPFHLGGAHMWS